MRLPHDVYDAVDGRKIKVFRADREMCRYWNERRTGNELRYYSGWYWYVEVNGRTEGNENGPYHSKSAAYKDAFLEMGLRRDQAAKTTQITGSNLVRLPKAEPVKRATRNDNHALKRRLRRARLV